MSDYNTIKAIHKKVFNGFTYVTDDDQFDKIEHWHLPEDISNSYGDCDDFAIMCRKLLREAGLISRLVFCETEIKGEYHLVCACGQYILDNRQTTVETKGTLSRLGYKWMYVSGLEPGDDWKKL